MVETIRTLVSIEVRVQTDDFDVSTELKQLREGKPNVGAVACFVGTVRDINEGTGVSVMTLEHYPGMTEQSLQGICQQAADRFDVESLRVVHRVGPLYPCDQIVMVAVASRHRGESFSACEFVMDYLKTKAPFWKKEATPEGDRWVQSRDSDDAAAARWANGPSK